MKKGAATVVWGVGVGVGGEEGGWGRHESDSGSRQTLSDCDWLIRDSPQPHN